MVHASVSFNQETKTYEWKSTDNANCKPDPTTFQITTPNHNMCIVRNFPQPTNIIGPASTTDWNLFDFGTLDAFIFENPKKMSLETLMNLKQCHSLCQYLWITCRPISWGFYVQMYHPIRDRWVFGPRDNIDRIILFIQSIFVDILNHVLEFDRQCKRDQLLEHQLLRSQFAQDMSAIVQSVPIQVQATPANPTHDCTYAKTGYCRGWQDGCHMVMCPEVTSRAC